MAERRTIENWGARLNVAGEALTMEEAMLLSLGHQNARLETMIVSLQDMQCRLTRLELLVRKMVGESAYDATTSQAVRALAEAS